MLAALMLAAGLAAANAAPVPLTLAQAVARAREASPLRGPADQLVRGSAEAARLAGRFVNPLIDVRVENFSMTGRSVLPLDVFAVVNQPLELGGKRGYRQGVAESERDLAGANLNVVERQITTRTIQLYVQALKARGLLETFASNREGLATLITAMRRRVEEGYSAESDLRRFETESARMDIDIARARLDLERSLTALTYVIGTPVPVTADQLVEPDAVDPPRLDAAGVASAVARHPEVVSATARLLRAHQIAALEHARRLPDPLISAGYKRTNGFDTAVAAVTVAVPLFDRNGSAAAKATGEALAAATERDAVASRIGQEIATLIATAQTLTERYLGVARNLLDPADVVRNAARSAFNEGTSDIMKLIDAERVYGDVRRTAVELRLDALAASLEARFAVGEETLP